MWSTGTVVVSDGEHRDCRAAPAIDVRAETPSTERAASKSRAYWFERLPQTRLVKIPARLGSWAVVYDERSAMRDRFHWARLLSFVTGLINHELLLRNDYLVAENHWLSKIRSGSESTSSPDC